ncbi:MAG: M20 family metallopeptidase [Candidatus Pacebacteria bacterium]|nr:M20 family metallopeptidase [Candidatus Paceibacterota bacterium]
METAKVTSDILKIASYSGHERNLADYLFTELLVMGHKPQKQDGNVVVRIEGKSKTKAIIFNAHMDTVSPGALSLWRYPPYGKEAGIQDKGKIYGLGASDAKGSIASLLILSKDLFKNPPEIDTWITFVCKEETGGDGTRSFLSWFSDKEWNKKYTEISAVICGPTKMEEFHIGHRGNLHAEITVSGQGGHGAEPDQIKRHAILEATKIIEELKKLEKVWSKKYADAVIGKPSIGITSISAGDPLSPNKFPDSCSFTIDVRTTPSLHKIALGLIEKLARKFNSDVKTVYTPSPPGHTDKNAKIVECAKTLVKKVSLGKESTDLCFFSEIGISGIILGAGSHDVSHKPNEYCEISEIELAIKTYRKLISLL